MTPLFKKLNFKGQKEINVLNAPSTFSQEQDAISAVTKVVTSEKSTAFEFLLAFVTKQDEVDNLAATWCPLAKGDAVLWFVYPKKTSKKYQCEFNRDTGWQVMVKLGWEGVRMVAIDEDWSALRFRKISHIKTITRSSALTLEGKGKAGK